MRFVLALLAFLALAAQATAQPVITLNHHTIPENPAIGYFIISIDISNAGENARGLSLYVTENEEGFYLINPDSGEKTSSVYLDLGDLSAGSTSAQIKAYAEKSGLYALKASLSYRNESGSEFGIEGVFGIAVYDLPFIYAGSTIEIRPDESREAEVMLRNLGGDVESAVIILNSDFITSDTALIESWSRGETKKVVLGLKADSDAVAGVYEAKIIVDYRSEFGEKGVAEVPVLVKIVSEPEVTLEVSTLPEKVYADSDFSLKVAITAKNSKLSGLTASLEAERFDGEKEKYVGTVEAGEKAVINFSLKSPRESGEYDVKLVLRTESFAKNFSVPLYISDYGRISIDLAGVYTSPQRVVEGEGFKLSIQVENSGEQDAKAVAVNLILPEGLEGRRSYFIGSLSSGDSATATFEMRALKAGSQKIVAEITYMDKTFEKHKAEREFEVYVFSADRSGVIAGLLALIAVIAAIAWLRMRRKA